MTDPECDHYQRQVKWISEENCISGEMESRLVDEWVSTTIDIDLNRFKCVQCGKIEYYTQPK